MSQEEKLIPIHEGYQPASPKWVRVPGPGAIEKGYQPKPVDPSALLEPPNCGSSIMPPPPSSTEPTSR